MDKYYELDVAFENLTNDESGDYYLYAKLKRNTSKIKKVHFLGINELSKNKNYYIYVLGGRKISKEKFYGREDEFTLLKTFYELSQKIKNKTINEQEKQLIFKLFKNKKLDEISIIKKNLGGLSIVMKGSKLIVEVCNNEIGKTFLNDPILENFKQVENDSIHSLVGSFELLENSFLFDFLVYFIDKYSFDVSLIKFC